MQDLRPVEKLYLMSSEGVEKINLHNAFVAIIAWLCSDGYLEIRGKTLQLTLQGKLVFTSGDDPGLRMYELDILDAIRCGGPEYIQNIVSEFDFLGFFVTEGIFVEEKVKKWRIFSRKARFKTEKYHQIIDSLKAELQALKKAIDEKQELNQEQLAAIYAYPSLCSSDNFKQYAAEVLKGRDDFANVQSLITMEAATVSIMLDSTLVAATATLGGINGTKSAN